MPAPLPRSLFVLLVLAVGGPAVGQSSDKDAQATPRPGSAKAATTKSAPATKRVDLVPSSSVKPTTTRPATPTQTPAPPAKQDWHCDSESADA